MSETAADQATIAETVVFLSHFKDLPDPRQAAKVLYKLDELLLLCLLAVLGGAEAITEIVRFGEKKLDLLRRFRPFVHGVPCHDQLGTILATLDAVAFQHCFVAWVAAIAGLSPDAIAIDGKTSRRSGKGKKTGTASHIVTAFAARRQLVLGQVNHRRFGQSEFTGRHHAAMTGNDDAVSTNQHRVHKAELGDRASDLRHLGVNGGGKTSQMAAQKSASFGGVSLFGWRPFPRPGLTFLGRRAQPRSRMAAGHRGAARSVLDGGEHGGNLARGGLIFPCWRRVSLGAAGSGTSVRAGFLLCRRRGCRSLLWPVCLCLDLGLARAALAEAVAVGVHLEDADVMCQAIEQRAG